MICMSFLIQEDKLILLTSDQGHVSFLLKRKCKEKKADGIGDSMIDRQEPVLIVKYSASYSSRDQLSIIFKIIYNHIQCDEIIYKQPFSKKIMPKYFTTPLLTCLDLPLMPRVAPWGHVSGHKKNWLLPTSIVHDSKGNIWKCARPSTSSAFTASFKWSHEFNCAHTRTSC